MPRASLAIALWLLLQPCACATQREQRISSADARERPTDEACERPGLANSNAPAPGSSWVCGYWHWDAVRYVWIEGHWTPRSSPVAAPR